MPASSLQAHRNISENRTGSSSCSLLSTWSTYRRLANAFLCAIYLVCPLRNSKQPVRKKKKLQFTDQKLTGHPLNKFSNFGTPSVAIFSSLVTFWNERSIPKLFHIFESLFITRSIRFVIQKVRYPVENRHMFINFRFFVPLIRPWNVV